MLVQDLQQNYPEIQDIGYDTFFTMDLISLHTLIELKKLDCKMTKAAIMIQNYFRRFT
jgi:hypothetical protein